MSEQTALAVQKTVTVKAPPERAFAAFTDGMSNWWPLATHHIGATAPTEVVIEPRVGGRWFERAADGSDCDWGRVLEWDPPRRLVLAWQLTADYAYDPDFLTEVEVRFTPAPDGGTAVELEHRGLEAFGSRAGEVRDTFASPGGWSGMLDSYAEVAAS